MLGAIAGDVIGAPYEGRPIKTEDFDLFSHRSVFTDDTVLTCAVAQAILGGTDYAEALRAFTKRYPHAGYGGTFIQWALNDWDAPYDSWGNGAAMRVAPVGWAFETVEDVLREAEASAAVTHNHPEGVKGAQATALAVYRARTGARKPEIRDEIEARFGYDLHRHLEEIRPGYQFDVSCQGSVPESLIAFLASDSVEDAIRKAISLGGDADTMACIAGAVAEAFYGGVPDALAAEVRMRLPDDLLDVVARFRAAYVTGRAV
jgi:ADP-ribosylglycohydrolase